MESVIKKAVKKLKLWSKKRSRKKKKQQQQLLQGHEHDAYYPPPPPLGPPPPPPLYQYDCHTHRCSSSSTQPSAPPLPVAAATASSWPETEHNYNYGTFLTPPEEVNYHAQASEIAMTLPMPLTGTSPAYPVPPYGYDHQDSVSSVSEPAVVYGIPVPLIQTSRRERSSIHFGFVLSFVAYLFRCLCPCFHSH